MKRLSCSRKRQRGRVLRFILIFIATALVIGVWSKMSSKAGPSATAILSDPTAMNQLARSTQASEVVMYTTSTCPYCHQAKAWFAQNLILYTECNVDTSSACSSAYKKAGMRGVPTLVVRGQQMRAGFNSAGFIELLSKKS